MDELLYRLSCTHRGRYFGSTFCAALGYADDIENCTVKLTLSCLTFQIPMLLSDTNYSKHTACLCMDVYFATLPVLVWIGSTLYGGNVFGGS